MAIKIHHSKEELLKLAETGNADAMYSIGYRYLKGIGGLPKSQDMAKEWFKKAADAGSTRAIRMINKNYPDTQSLEDQAMTASSEASYSYSSSIPTEQEGGVPIGWGLSIIMLFVFIVIFYLNRKNKKEKDKKIILINKSIDRMIAKHIKALSVRKKQLTKIDSYGNIIDKDWQEEINYFIDKTLKRDYEINILLGWKDTFSKLQSGKNFTHESFEVMRQTTHYKEWEGFPDRFDIQQKIEWAVSKYDESEKLNGADTQFSNVDIEQLSPIAFEHYCADILNANGWQARVTQASGDQGIDIIASFNGIEAVFQCKKYSSPVGNKAVQEVIAGKQFSRASVAAVVSSAAFTPSAKQLADTTGVYLLHYSELGGFTEKISKSGC